MGDVSLDGRDLQALLDSVRPLRHRRDEAALLTVLCSVRRLVQCDRACWRWWVLEPTASTYVHVHDPADVGRDPDRAPCPGREMDHRRVIGVVLPSCPGERNLLVLSRRSGARSRVQAVRLCTVPEPALG
jgi:hypothetical protein